MIFQFHKRHFSQLAPEKQAMGSSLMAVNGVEAWGYATELTSGLRVRFTLDDWQRMNIGPGQRVPVQRPGREDVWLFVTHLIETPPVVWVVLSKRVPAVVCDEAAETDSGRRGSGSHPRRR
jgi:hypothetical protein